MVAPSSQQTGGTNRTGQVRREWGTPRTSRPREPTLCTVALVALTFTARALTLRWDCDERAAARGLVSGPDRSASTAILGWQRLDLSLIHISEPTRLGMIS